MRTLAGAPNRSKLPSQLMTAVDRSSYIYYEIALESHWQLCALYMCAEGIRMVLVRLALSLEALHVCLWAPCTRDGCCFAGKPWEDLKSDLGSSV